MRCIRLALLGFGTVGSGVARLLADEADRLRQQSGVEFAIDWIVVRDPHKTRALSFPPETRLSTDPAAAIDDPRVDIAVEVMGGVEPAFSIISRFLRAGKHVVTANKAVLAEHGRELFAIAHEHDRAICFEASVAGGIPILAAVSQGLAPNRITALSGILNGTTNFILTEMQEGGKSYRAALAKAQELGFAEKDPTLDVDGTDAAQKLAILARLAFQSVVDPARIPRNGIDKLSEADLRFASELGYAVKLLAVARNNDGRLLLRVTPTLVPTSNPMGQVRGEYNAVHVVGHAVGDTFYSGKGAGRMPTAASVVAGLLDLAIGRGQETFRSLRLWDDRPPGPRFTADAFMKSRFYLRYTIRDQPGTLARIAGILGRHGISISSVMQHETGEGAVGAAVPLIVMTHRADEGALHIALAETDALDDIVREPTVCLPVAD